MRYNVAGADTQTGDDRVITVEARDERAAEEAARSEGLLVAAVFPVQLLSPAEKLNAMVGQSAPATQATPAPTVSYQTSGAVVIPEYGGLRAASVALRVMAVLSYVAGAALILIFIVGMLLSNPYRSSTAWGWMNFMLSVLTAASPIAAGAVLHGASAACTAIRDIARNSFR